MCILQGSVCASCCAGFVYLSLSSSCLHSLEISTLNCFLVQKLLRRIRTWNGLCLGKSVRHSIDCAYWVQLKRLSMNYSCLYYNYCANCNHVWTVNFSEAKGTSVCLPALYYLRIVMWSFFRHYNCIHYEDDDLCCLKGKQSFRRITPLSFN